MKQAHDFVAESQILFDTLSRAPAHTLTRSTQFKSWTVEDVIRHLHVWNGMAELSATDSEKFQSRMDGLNQTTSRGQTVRSFEKAFVGDVSGAELLGQWAAGFKQVGQVFETIDPKSRVLWAGPSMSARSSITARQMETWAHGQEIYDLLGVECPNSERIENIATMGYLTYGWTFHVRGEMPPEPTPYVHLVGPSGAVFEYGVPSQAERVEGSAVDFCQVVTQTRNIQDTSLTVIGPNATRWMSMAQCFAGPPETPPAPGTRCQTQS